jgi:hypothetical protein
MNTLYDEDTYKFFVFVVGEKVRDGGNPYQSGGKRQKMSVLYICERIQRQRMPTYLSWPKHCTTNPIGTF